MHDFGENIEVLVVRYKVISRVLSGNDWASTVARCLSLLNN